MIYGSTQYRVREYGELMWCLECNEPVECEEHIDESVGWRELRCCQCGSDEIEEPNTCKVCGELCAPDAEMCNDCMQEVFDTLHEARDVLRSGHPRLTVDEAMAILVDAGIDILEG